MVTGYVLPQFHVKHDDFFETVQETKALPQSKWQQLARFVTETGAPLKEPTRAKGASSRTQSATQSWVIPQQEDPFRFDLVDLGEADDDLAPSDNTNGDPPPPLAPREQPTQDKPPDPERHRHPEATRRSARLRNPTARLIESTYAVLDETDVVEDYGTQTMVEDPIAFAASTSNPDILHSPLSTLHSTLYTLHSTLYTLHSTLYTLHSTLRQSSHEC
jgi:hypothetical protein